MQERFDEAQGLARRGHDERATNLLVECVIAEPGNIDFVQGFLEHLARPSAATTTSPPTNGQSPIDPPPALKQALAEDDWPQVLRLAPRHLAADPFHVPTLIALAGVAAHHGFGSIEQAYLQRALEIAPDDVEVNRKLGGALARTRQFDEALARWQHVEALDTDDRQAAPMIAALTIERSRQRLGLASQRPEWQAVSDAPSSDRRAARGTSPSARAAQAAASSSSGSASNLRRTPIQELEVALREYPSNPEYYVQLVPLYLETGREYDAERLLDKGRQATANDPRVCQLWEDVSMLRMERKFALAEKHFRENNTLQAQAELAEVKAERDQLETNIFVSRCKREPHNAAARIQLGVRLRRAGKHRDACQRLEEALQDAAHRSSAALELGECYREQNEPDEALRYYRLAADAATQPSQLDSKKQGLYQAGRLAAHLKLRKLSERYLDELLRVDPNCTNALSLLAEIRRAGA